MKEYLEKGYVINLLEHNDKVYHYADRDKENIVNGTVQALCEVIIKAEAADVQPVKHGEWQINPNISHEPFCSECKETPCYRSSLPKFCPNCGARMEMLKWKT